MTLPNFPSYPSETTPRDVPPEVAAGSFVAGPWLLAFGVLVLGGALYASNLPDMFYVLEQLYAIAAAACVFVVIVSSVWARRAAVARRVFRDGALVPSVVVKRVDLRAKGGSMGYDTTVRFVTPDGRAYHATFRLVNQQVKDPKVLFLDGTAGLHLTAYSIGEAPVDALFRSARAEPAH